MLSASFSVARAAVISFFLVSSFHPSTWGEAAPIVGLDSFLSEQYLLDSLALNDSYGSLPSSLKKALASSTLPGIQSLIHSLVSFELPVSVHVKLVGSFSPSSRSVMLSFLSSTLTSDYFHTISPSDHQDHRLILKHSLHVDVSLSTLASRLSEAIGSEISQSISSIRSPLRSVPHDAVDSIIHKDFEKENPLQTIYIYLLNLGSQSNPYAYSYGEGDASLGYTKCLGSVWAGRERYIWIDLAAGPVDYGPSLSGDGVMPKGDFHPLTALHGKPKSQKAFLADMASLVYSAYHLLLVPPLRIPVLFEATLTVQFIHIHGSETKDPQGLNWNTIEKSLNDGGLLMGEQSLAFSTHSLLLEECPICSFAIWRSTNSYTSRFLFDNYTLIASEYLDSKRLHQVLTDSSPEFRRLADVPEEGDGGRALPVYVFDLDYSSLLLLDRHHQSVSFRDMVIAVRTRMTQTVSDYSCNGRHVFTQTREMERPLVASIMQSMWGVSPTHLTWSSARDTTLVDYTWSVGHTPFGPFSETPSLSFVQRDAARRNVLLTSLNYTIESALEIVRTIDSHGGYQSGTTMRILTDGEFAGRWNLLKYKLDKAVSSLSRFDFEMSVFFLRSADHDLYSLHSVAYEAFGSMDVSLSCFNDPPFPWPSVSFSIIALAALYYVFSIRERLFRNKRKQF